MQPLTGRNDARMKVFLITKRGSTAASDCAVRAAEELISRGVAVVTAREYAMSIRNLPAAVECLDTAGAAFSACDAVVAIGGDGTIFHAAADAVGFNKPVLGINAGNLGFLAQLEGDDVARLAELAAGDYDIERCFVIEAQVFHRHSGKHIRMHAVNDIVISKTDFGHVSHIEVRCRGDLVGQYRADGIIFATPTGSTAYSLSAGGPIVDPAAKCILMTPLASHSLVSRTIIFGKDKELTVTVPAGSGESLCLTVDGRAIDAVGEDAVVTIRRSEYQTQFIRLHGYSFYRILNEKMKHRG